MIAAVIFMWILMDKSKFGRELKITGSNPSFAKYAGLKIGGIVIGSQLIGGMLAGLGGGVEMIGMYTHFQWITAQTYVWDGILINLLAGTKPLMIPVSAFLSLTSESERWLCPEAAMWILRLYPLFRELSLS